MYDLAIIGGMGPEATAALFSRLIARTQAGKDQEHMRLCVLNDPQIPDRSAYLLEGGENPLPRILAGIRQARDLGCRRFVIPCNTAHCFAEEYAAVPGIAFIDLVAETQAALRRDYPGQAVCLLATSATVKTGVYSRGQGAKGLLLRYPSPRAQQRVMAMIREIKAGGHDPTALARELVTLLETDQQRFGVYVLACTELSLLAPALGVLRPGLFLDAMEVLVRSAIRACGYQVKEEAQSGIMNTAGKA